MWEITKFRNFKKLKNLVILKIIYIFYLKWWKMSFDDIFLKFFLRNIKDLRFNIFKLLF
jgi:hypothetical protein